MFWNIVITHMLAVRMLFLFLFSFYSAMLFGQVPRKRLTKPDKQPSTTR